MQRSQQRFPVSRVPRVTLVPTVLLALALLTAMAGPAAAQAGPPQTTDLTALDLEQLMQLEVVFAASKRNQNPREAASVVSVVTAAEIRQYGYRTLADVLRSLPSFYISYDRNYSYVGVRGFAQPGDFNSRVLLLVNGLRTNDNVYDMAYIGEEFIVDMDLIERVEIVRGPSAAVYGSSAFFSVINVVTKTAADVAGGELSTSAASFDTYAGRATWGATSSKGIGVLLSATLSDAGGQRLYFAEFDDPATNGGVVNRADAESFHKLFGSVAKGGFSAEASHVQREKEVPTGAYGTAFNDPRNRTTDKLSLASLRYDRSSARGSMGARLHAGRFDYHGDYAYTAAAPNQDLSTGEWWGLDLDATRSLRARHQITAGLEYRDNFRQDQQNFDPEPRAVYLDEQHGSRRLGVFAQDEIRLARPLALYAGIRHDWYQTFDGATSPRLGLIYTPDDATTIKVLLGRAFRAPNEYELHFSGLGFKANPDLGPERISTLELAAVRMIGAGVGLSAAAFRNRISDLIIVQRDPSDDLVAFRNAGDIDSDGVELALQVNRGRGPSGRLSYALQKTSNHASGERLVNSPRHMAKLQMTTALVERKLSASADAQYVSARETLSGAEAKGYAVTNVSLVAPDLFDRIEGSATIYNVFAARYGFPGNEEHTQDIIQQDGRTFRVKATVRF